MHPIPISVSFLLKLVFIIRFGLYHLQIVLRVTGLIHQWFYI